MTVRSYDRDTAIGYVFTVTLNFDVWPWVKFMTLPYVILNIFVIYNSDPIPG